MNHTKTSDDLEQVAPEKSDQKEPLIEKDHNKEKTKVLWGYIKLNEGISRTNFWASLIFVIYIGVIAIAFSTLEPEFLNDEFSISSKHLGEMTAFIYLIDYSARLVFALILGPMIDYFGRKFVMTIGILFASAGYTLIPVLTYNVYTGYFVAKSFISVGAIALQMQPFIADYIDHSTKGLMSGMTYAMLFVGATIGSLILKLLLTLNLKTKLIYLIWSAIIIVFGFAVRCGIKGGNTYYRNLNTGEEKVEERRLSLWKQTKGAWHAFRTIPWILYSTLFSILGHTDLYIVTTGLVIWIKSMIPDDEDAALAATNFQTIFVGIAFISVVYISLQVDKKRHMKLIFPLLGIACSGFLLVMLIKSLYNPLIYVFFVMEGASLPGLFVFSTYLAMRYYPNEIRGAVSGIGNAISFCGAILTLTIGGYLHDKWRSDGNFLTYGALLWIVLILVFIIYKKMIQNATEDYANDYPDNPSEGERSEKLDTSTS